MKTTKRNVLKAYEAPDTQVVEIAPMQFICQSNTENIDIGGDDIPWGVSKMDDIFDLLKF